MYKNIFLKLLKIADKKVQSNQAKIQVKQSSEWWAELWSCFGSRTFVNWVTLFVDLLKWGEAKSKLRFCNVGRKTEGIYL